MYLKSLNKPMLPHSAKIKLFILTILFSVTSYCYSQPQQVWERYNIGTGSGSSNPIDLKIDDNGFIYNLAQEEGGYRVYKYNQSGTLIWKSLYLETIRLNITPKSFVIDNIGNVYVTGDNADYIVTVKFDSSGTFKWDRKYIPSVGLYTLGGISLDTQNNIIVSGDLSSNPLRILSTTIKYSPVGDTLWVKHITGLSNEVRSADSYIETDDSGNTFGACTVYYDTLASQTHARILNFKLNQNGDVIWIKRFYREGAVINLKLDSEKNIYTIAVIDSLETKNNEIVILKYDSAGNFNWNKIYKNTQFNSDVSIYGFTIDFNNNLILTGSSYYGSVFPSMITVKYDKMGNFRWDEVFREKNSNYNYSFDVTVDSANNIYISGASEFDAGVDLRRSITSVKYDSSGNFKWKVSNFSPLNRNSGKKILFYNNFIYVFGSMLWTNNNFNSILIKYSEDPSSIVSQNLELDYSLSQNYPNPFNGSTKITVSINKTYFTRITIYNIEGKQIAILTNKSLTAGNHTFYLNSENLNSGVYFYTLYLNDIIADTRKMILIK